MPISVLCPNGHKLSAKEKLAGKKIKCPKCGAVVRIPEPEPHEPEPVIAETEPETEEDRDEHSGSTAEDPYGFGEEFGDSDSWAADEEEMGDPYSNKPKTPKRAAPARDRTDKPAKGKKPDAKSNKKLMLAVAGGGSLLGLPLVGFLGWIIFGGSDEVAAPNEPAPVADVREPAVPEVIAQIPPPDEPSPAAPMGTPPAAVAEPTVPKIETVPFSLTRIQSHPSIDAFELPGTTWSSAYDEVSGRLAVTNDDAGILFYNLDEILKGNLAPVASIRSNGLPTAVCLKPLKDRRVFVFGGHGGPDLVLMDTETLQTTGPPIVLSGLKYVDFLDGSPSPQDPFVYYSTENTPTPNPGNANNNDTVDRLGRINLATGKQDELTQQQVMDLRVSPFSNLLYTRNSSGTGVIGSWDEIISAGVAAHRSTPDLPRNPALTPVGFLGDTVADRYAAYTPTMKAATARMDYMPRAAFRNRPVLVGLGKGELVFGSTNDYRPLASTPLPPNWFDTDRWTPPNDFRLRQNMAPDVRTAYIDFQTDDTRETAIITFSDHLVIAPLSRAEIPAEPSLIPMNTFPKTFAAGARLELELQLQKPVNGVVFEYIPNTDWLPDEKTPLLGLLPPGQASPRPLELNSGVSREQSFVILKSYKPLAAFKMPFKLRIGNEVMEAMKYDRVKLVVNRTSPVQHGGSERIAVVDDDGTMLTRSEAPSKPQGKRLALAASINKEQEIIFVGDLRPFSGRRLPATILIGDEKMTLVSVDDFKTALMVKRTDGVPHCVASEAWLLDDEKDVSAEAGPNLPVVEGTRFQWTPNGEQLGKQRIRMRARSGRYVHDWLWEIEIELPIAELPFQVAGIEPQRGTDLAVIWGQSQPLTATPSTVAKKETEPNTFFLATYDLKGQVVRRQVELPKPILKAIVDKSGVYAVLDARDTIPKADPLEEAARRRTNSQPLSTQLLKLDLKSLKTDKEVTLPAHADSLSVIADKYLTVSAGTEILRFNLPDMSPITPPIQGVQHSIVGRVGNRWIWDGVIWDKQMTKPELLLFPFDFASDSRSRSPAAMVAAEGGTIYMMTEGPFACTWFPINLRPTGQRLLQDFPGGLSYRDGTVTAHSWAAPSQPRVNGLEETSIQLVDRETLAVKSGNSLAIGKSSAYLSEADGRIHAALGGKLYTLPLDQLVRDDGGFRFVEQQDQFVLESGQSTTVHYSAPDAVKYHFQLWFQKPEFPDDEPSFKAESDDGTFQLPMDESERYASFALLNISGISTASSGRERQAFIDKYLARIEPHYEALTGKKPWGVPFPVYISVIAEHSDGQQKAGLAHSYLIEVPLSQVQELASR